MHQFLRFYNEFGASPRDLAIYASDPAAYDGLVVEEIMAIKPADLRYISQNPAPISHRVFTIEPSPIGRDRFEKRIASRRVFELLWEEHLWSRVPT